MRHGEFFGVATVGERGQIVIPIEARKAYNIEIGDKLMVFGRRYGGGLLLIQADVFLKHLNETMAELTDLGRLLEDLREGGVIEDGSPGQPPGPPVDGGKGDGEPAGAQREKRRRR